MVPLPPALARIIMFYVNLIPLSKALKMKRIIFTGLLLVCLLSGSCAPSQSFDARLKSIAKPYLFSIAMWELKAIPDELNQWIFGRQEKIDDEVGVVTEYFSATKRINALKSEIAAANTGKGESDLASLEAELNRLQERKMTLEDAVERIIEKQITETLTQHGIFNPIDKYIR